MLDGASLDCMSGDFGTPGGGAGGSWAPPVGFRVALGAPLGPARGPFSVSGRVRGCPRAGHFVPWGGLFVVLGAPATMKNTLLFTQFWRSWAPRETEWKRPRGLAAARAPSGGPGGRRGGSEGPPGPPSGRPVPPWPLAPPGGVPGKNLAPRGGPGGSSEPPRRPPGHPEGARAAARPLGRLRSISRGAQDRQNV